MKYNFFHGSAGTYHASSYFYRIEFQQRGAPHVHSLVWLKDQDDQDAPNFWAESQNTEKMKMEQVEEFADRSVKKVKKEKKNKEEEFKKDNKEQITTGVKADELMEDDVKKVFSSLG